MFITIQNKFNGATSTLVFVESVDFSRDMTEMHLNYGKKKEQDFIDLTKYKLICIDNDNVLNL